MRYQELSPHPRVQSFIDSYWILEHDGTDAAPQRVVPDGHSELILNLAEPFESWKDGEWRRQPRFFLAGQIEGPLLLRPGGAAKIIGIRLQPHGAAALFGGSMAELAGQFTALDSLSATLSREVERALDSPRPMVRLEAAFAGAVERRGRPADPMVPIAVQRMMASQGQSELSSLAADFGLSIRHFERRFQASVGLPPKLFCRLQRFLGVFRAMSHEESRWADAAVACCYFDQSHLIRDFKQFTGETPSVLLNQDADLARHFLERFGVSHSSKTAGQLAV